LSLFCTNRNPESVRGRERRVLHGPREGTVLPTFQRLQQQLQQQAVRHLDSSGQQPASAISESLAQQEHQGGNPERPEAAPGRQPDRLRPRQEPRGVPNGDERGQAHEGQGCSVPGEGQGRLPAGGPQRQGEPAAVHPAVQVRHPGLSRRQEGRAEAVDGGPQRGGRRRGGHEPQPELQAQVRRGGARPEQEAAARRARQRLVGAEGVAAAERRGPHAEPAAAPGLAARRGRHRQALDVEHRDHRRAEHPAGAGEAAGAADPAGPGHEGAVREGARAVLHQGRDREDVAQRSQLAPPEAVHQRGRRRRVAAGQAEAALPQVQRSHQHGGVPFLLK